MKLRLWMVYIGMVALAACGKPGAQTAPTAALQAKTAPPVGANADESGPDQDDPCKLLQVAEVEVALGPLSAPPYRSNANNDEPKEHGDSCRYVGRDLRYIELNVSRSGGSQLLQGMDVGAQVANETRMKGQIPRGLLPADSSFTGDWDDLRVLGCCRLNAFLGESLVVLDFTGSRLTALQGVGLVNKALLRLDKPLPIDGRTGLQAAKQRLAAAANHPRPCQLVTRAEAEAIVGKLTAEPVESDSECDYKYRGEGDASDSNEVVVLKVDWSYGFSHFRENATVHSLAGGEKADLAAKTMSDIGKVMQEGGGSFESLAKAIKQTEANAKGKAAAEPQKSAAPESAAKQAVIQGPWDEAAFAYPEFLAVKKDVLLRVEAGLTAEIGQKFATKAMQKI